MQDRRRRSVARTGTARRAFEQSIAIVETIQQCIVVIITSTFGASFHKILFRCRVHCLNPLIRTTSLVVEPREKRVGLPSRERSKLAI